MDNAFFEFFLYSDGAFAYWLAFALLLACGFGLPIPEDLTLFTMGYLSYLQVVEFRTSVLVCMAGVMIGDITVFFFGRRLGNHVLRSRLIAKALSEERLEKTRALFLKWGNKVIFASRFMPGLRAASFFSAGMLKLPFRVFFFYDGLAALLSVPLLTGATYYFGSQIERAIQVAKSVQFGIVGLIVGIIALFLAKHYLANRGRRRKHHS